MRIVRQFSADMVTLFGVVLALATPLDARADDLSPADLASIDQALSASRGRPCAEPREHLRALRDAYARQDAAIVQSAIAARVPMALDNLRFCIDTTTAQAGNEQIESARQILVSAREREECAVPAAGIEQLIAGWEAEDAPVVRGAIERRIETLASTVRFCLETLGGDGGATTATTATPRPTLVPLPPVAEWSDDAPGSVPPEAVSTEATAVVTTGGRALGSPFRPTP